MPGVKAITNKYKDDAKALLQETIDEAPDAVVLVAFWQGADSYKVKTSAVPDRLKLIGILEDIKAKIIADGVIS
jgi:pyruvate/2-oxoglutarate/acetoin dehydrogenase E1 component